MYPLSVIIFLLSLIMLVVGLINPKLAIYWGAKRTRKQVLIYYIPIIIISFILVGVFFNDPYKNTALALSIDEPTGDKIEVMTDKINIKGSVSIPKAKIRINNKGVLLSGNDFNYTVNLQYGENKFQVVATYPGKEDKKEIIVNRKITPDEQAELDKQKSLEEEKAKAAVDAKALADMDPNEQKLSVVKDNQAIRTGYARKGYSEDVDYNLVPVEDIVKSTFQKMQIPEGTKLEVLEDDNQTGFSIVRYTASTGDIKVVWAKTDEIVSKELYDFCKEEIFTNSDCERVKRNEIWIGMSLAMLVKERGVFDTKDVSNSGSGNSWQFCWWNYTPKCFYDYEDDGHMDSYN